MYLWTLALNKWSLRAEWGPSSGPIHSIFGFIIFILKAFFLNGHNLKFMYSYVSLDN